MIRPTYLQPGDKVTLVSLSGHIPSPEEWNNITGLLKDWGLTPVPSPHLFSRDTRDEFAPEEILQDWQSALNDEDCRAIWCLDGDYGSLRIVEEADYSVFQGNPKWIIGMNDTTVLHAKLYTLGIESLHAFTPDKLHATSPEAINQVRNYLFGIISSYATPRHEYNRLGFSEGELIGGNLGWFHSLHATRLEHYTRGTILFIEESTDDLNLIDRYIRCIKYSGILQHIEGMIVGQLGTDNNPSFQEKANRIIRAAIEEYDFPVCFNFPAGLTKENYPLILGTGIELVVSINGGKIQFS